MTLPKRSAAPPSGIPSWARVGAKVVCVDDAPPPSRIEHYSAWLVQNEVYTIREVQWVEPHQGYQVRLVEISNTPRFYVTTGVFEPAYALRRFRPLITLEHDMAVHFERLLDVPAGVDA